MTDDATDEMTAVLEEGVTARATPVSTLSVRHWVTLR